MNNAPAPRGVPVTSAHANAIQSTHSGYALWMKITLTHSLLNVAAQRFWMRPELPAFFPRYLLELHSMMRCAVPLLRSGYEWAAELAPSDPLAARAAVYLRAHVDEEMHHDEWLLDDMIAAGMERDTILRHTPSPQVAQLIGAQYYWIRHAHPAALFGYLAVLEGNPPLEQHLDEIQQITGYPPEAFRCLRLHAADDIEHLHELQATIEQLPLTAQAAELISASAFATMHGVVALLDQLTASK
jgi:hypothetical protein